jgi:DNA-binding transcriptional MerR regulator
MPGPEAKSAVFTIRQLCREFGVTARALRFYEDKGLLHPGRRGQTRVYSARDRARLTLILRGKRVGFSLVEIRDLLDLYDRKDGGVTQMAVSLKRFQEQLVTLKRQREDLEGAIETLESGCAWLEEQLAAVPPERLPRAADYDALLRSRLGEAEDEDDDYRPRKPARARI